MGKINQTVRWLVLCAAVASAPVKDTCPWTGKADDRRAVVMDLVRDDVTVDRTAETSIAIDASNEAAQIEAVEQADSVRVGDRYPARSAVAAMAMADCLPPAEERGDY